MPVYRKTASEEKELLRRPRLPRLGIIRLGYKETRKRADGNEYTFPRAADHFVLVDAQAVAAVYGDAPTVLEPVYLPVDNEDLIASHYLRMYAQTWGLICFGDGLTARRQVDPDRMRATGEPVPASHETKRPESRQVNCPCPYLDSGDCRETMYLSFMLPEVEGAGVWQISTGSINSIRNVQGTLAMIRAIAGRINDIPLRLSLVPLEVVSTERGGKVKVHVLQFSLLEHVTAYELAQGAQSRTIGLLPPPDETPPFDSLPLEPAAPMEEYGDTEAPPVESWTPKADLNQSQQPELTLAQWRTKIIAYIKDQKLKTDFMRGLIHAAFGADKRLADLDGGGLADLYQLLTDPPDNLIIDQATGEIIDAVTGLPPGQEPPPPSQEFLHQFYARAAELGIAPINTEVPKVLGTPDEPVTLSHFLMRYSEDEAMAALEDWAKARARAQRLAEDTVGDAAAGEADAGENSESEEQTIVDLPF